jgi:hypothetical protein
MSGSDTRFKSSEGNQRQVWVTQRHWDELMGLLADARTEIDRWGHGDFHYGETPRDPGVVKMLARLDEVLGNFTSNTQVSE